MRSLDTSDVQFQDMPQALTSTGIFTWKQTFVCLALLTCLAFGLRVANLGAAGFAEDEVHKVEAIAAYRQGDFAHNLEHPMLMKLAMGASLRVSEQWNQRVPVSCSITPEAAIRFPNCVFGALTTLVLGLLAAELFNPLIGILAGMFWATGMLSLAINRIGKEDTFLVFFLLLAYYAYLHAKHLGMSSMSSHHRRIQAHWYTLSGASFGLMIASKYFPHYWGLLFLWEYLDHKLRPTNPLTNPIPRFVFPRFYGAMVGCFLIGNPIVWMSPIFSYVINYVSEETVTHHGYMMMDMLFYNTPSHTAFTGGLPLYFYGLMLGIKTQPLVLIGLAVGVIVTLRRIGQSQYFFIVFMAAFWLVPFSIIGAKWMRYTLSLLPFVYLVAAIGIYEIGNWGYRLYRFLSSTRTGEHSFLEHHPDIQEHLVAAALAVITAIVLIPCLQQMPFYSLYTNTFGGGEARAGTYFPHDEFYDAGVREALASIAQLAPHGASVVSETPWVARYYCTQFGRLDLKNEILSDARVQLDTEHPKFVIVQRGRYYFENIERIHWLTSHATLVKEIYVAGKGAAQIYACGKNQPERFDSYIVQARPVR